MSISKEDWLAGITEDNRFAGCCGCMLIAIAILALVTLALLLFLLILTAAFGLAS